MIPPGAAAGLLDSYLGADGPERADIERIRAALGHGDAFSRTAALHVTGSALVVHRASQRVLLRWHPKMAQWMQVGGHFDPGETDPLVVAQREAGEETGLRDLAPVGSPSESLVQIVIVPVPESPTEPAHEHADFRFVLVTARPDDIRPESAAAALKWTSFAQAHAEVAEANLRVFLERTRAVSRLGTVRTVP